MGHHCSIATSSYMYAMYHINSTPNCYIPHSFPFNWRGGSLPYVLYMHVHTINGKVHS